MNNKLTIIIALYLVALYVVCIYYDYQCVQLEEALITKQNEITSIQDELLTTQNDLQLVVDETTDLNLALDNIGKQLKNYSTLVDDLKGVKSQLIYLGDFKLTHYCTESVEHICGTGDGITATGTQVTAGRTIAVDPTVIPYGTQVYIEGYGWRIAEDCGGAVNGNHIDIAVDTHSQAISMGTTNGGVWILIPKTS
jgi:3D (Asp-Asp-Asp) domain-containing protein